MLVLSCRSNGFEFWSLNHTQIFETVQLMGFKYIKFLSDVIIERKIKNRNVYKTLDSCWLLLLTILQQTNATSNFEMRYVLTISIFSYLTFRFFKWFHPFRCLKFKIIPCFNFKCNPIFYFIYMYSYWRIISLFFMFLNDILKIILNIWYRIWSIK